MTTLVKSTSQFDKESRRLIRKYRSLRAELSRLRDELHRGERPGVRLSGTGYATFKTRMPNRSARRGKSGGFRVIYQIRSGQLVLLLIIYSKTERADIPDDEVRRLLRDAD